ncbi:GGDEF domain-containing protein [Reinekea sp.]|jgi:diguanylate cyclase (GGDEF)-like protein|uniref:GGDEF domain-containing protein n=1 Tax=Reinekea sp. TaxID=1970455 RepID=UPI003988AED8
MIKNSTALTSSTTLIATMHDLNIGILILDRNNQVIQANTTAELWFGEAKLEGVYLSDSWLSQQAIKIKDLELKPITTQTLLSSASTPLCIETSQQQNWLSVQSDKTQWQGQAVTVIILANINVLINDYIQLQQHNKTADARDLVTGLHNRRHALERMQQMHNYGKRYGGAFTIGLIDIDHCKRINDTYGNDFGDEVITKVARTLKNALRETDFCARYSSEEFLVLMPETSMIDSVITLDRLRQQVSELKWDNQAPPITVSAGVHMWQRNKSLEQLLFETDQRLNMAKSAGRNQVCGDLS